MELERQPANAERTLDDRVGITCDPDDHVLIVNALVAVFEDGAGIYRKSVRDRAAVLLDEIKVPAVYSGSPHASATYPSRATGS
jgi:hypothetical protein